MLFPTITAEHWREAFRRHRASPGNPLAEQILRLMPPSESPVTPVFLDHQRWQFLFPAGMPSPQYQLHAPDLLETRWSVYDRVNKATVAYGITAAQAADAAMHVIESRLRAIA